ncbi:MAG: M48 family metallopeptidase [Acidobacteriota bacterium]|jgi:Zn-dependent protease with chaperone function
MDFFGYQDQANRSTRKLMVLFVLAIVTIIVSIYIVTVLLFVPPEGLEENAGLYILKLISRNNFSLPSGVGIGDWLMDRQWWYPRWFFSLAVILSVLIVCGSAFKISQLRRGGRTVASMLGGRLILPETTDPDERRLLNVVEEMAIASGTPVPAVYLMDEEAGINAFAAGFSQKDMVIGVTRGSIRLLSRDELQGVIAHEFSHILRGDMRLNMRLMGTVFGITMISMIGYFILRFSTTGFRLGSGGSRSGKKRGKGGGGPGAAILILGVLLYVIGYLGVFFGNLIKSAIARQREYLADASSVQFTRNPAGLAGALKKIGGLSRGSRILSPHAHEASHFYFCNGLKRSFFQFLATHPPLTRRILRLDPSFTGEFPKIESPQVRTVPESKLVSELSTGPPVSFDAGLETIDAHKFIANIGTLTSDQIDYAASLRENLPEELHAALKEPAGAAAVVLSLLLSREESVRTLQTREIEQDAPEAISGETAKLSSIVQGLDPDMRIPLLDWAMPALRNLSDRQYKQFRSLMEKLISADKHTDLFEFCLQRMVRRYLDSHFYKLKPAPMKYARTEQVLPEALHLLSALAWVGSSSETEARMAFSAGSKELNLSERKEFEVEPESESMDLSRMDQIIHQLSQARPYVKKNLLFSCAQTVASDGQVLEAERELLRAIADSLELPVPPFIRELIKHPQKAGMQ